MSRFSRAERRWLTVIGVLILLWIIGKATQAPMPPTPPMGSAAAARQYRMVHHHYGCLSGDLYNHLAKLEPDRAAFEPALLMAIYERRCVEFDALEPVALMDTSILGGLVQIRRPGKPLSYWTSIRAVKADS